MAQRDAKSDQETSVVRLSPRQLVGRAVFVFAVMSSTVYRQTLGPLSAALRAGLGSVFVALTLNEIATRWQESRAARREST